MRAVLLCERGGGISLMGRSRKLSGAFLLCARLGATVDCAEMWERVTGGYTFEDVATGGEKDGAKVEAAI